MSRQGQRRKNACIIRVSGPHPLRETATHHRHSTTATQNLYPSVVHFLLRSRRRRQTTRRKEHKIVPENSVQEKKLQ